MLHIETSRINVVFLKDFNNVIHKTKKNDKRHMEGQRPHAAVKDSMDQDIDM